jgi:lipoprotein-anchoring transpeptidase ErfK/SrfK
LRDFILNAVAARCVAPDGRSWITNPADNAAAQTVHRSTEDFPGLTDAAAVQRWSKGMLTRAAAALAVTIGAGLLGIASAEARPEMVGYRGDYAPGTIVVKTNERRLYLTVDSDRAIRYPVGVGKAGKQWAGTARIDGKYRNPAWAPPADVKRDHPNIPEVIAGGSPSNPMGVAAMTLSGGGQYAIHGTNRPQSVGHFVSYGCIRMYNNDIDDLYRRVSIGTPVVVTQR